MKFFIVNIILICFSIENLKAQEYFFTEGIEGCSIQAFKNGKLEIVPHEPFVDMPLRAKELKHNPEYLGFTVDKQVYVSLKKCLKLRVRTVKMTLPDSDVDKYYVEFEAGLMRVPDRNQTPSDYNLLFPSTDPTAPVEWATAASSTYSAKNLFQLGFGIKASSVSYFAFKVKMFTGAKKDTVTLTDLNTSTTQTGTWNYNDLFINAYIGYKIHFVPKNLWKIMLGGYVGASQYSSNLSDGTNSFKLTSSLLLPVFLADLGTEYRVETKTALGLNVGYEYLGTRTISTSTASNIKTKISYTNYFTTLVIKYYF